MPDLAADLVRAKVDVIVAPSSAETGRLACRDQDRSYRVQHPWRPVGIGHVASLARPGGNATGLTTLVTELVAKELEASKEALPQARRLGVLYASTNPLRVSVLKPPRRLPAALGSSSAGFR